VKAFVLTRYGTAPELRDAPSAGARELLVRVHAAGLNPVDYKTRDGKLKVIVQYSLPVVMGNELAGVVEACGEGVSRFVVDDRVYARVSKQRMGAFA
jgi:alcohol dehydrogenase